MRGGAMGKHGGLPVLFQMGKHGGLPVSFRAFRGSVVDCGGQGVIKKQIGFCVCIYIRI